MSPISIHALRVARASAAAALVGLVAGLAGLSSPASAAPVATRAAVAVAVSSTVQRPAVATAATADGAQRLVEGFQPVTAQRLVDTTATALPAGSITTADSLGTLGLPATDVDAVVARVTATATAKTVVTVWDATRPRQAAADLAKGSAELTVAPGAATTQLAIVPVSAAGRLAVRSSDAAVRLTVDLVGYVPQGSAFRAVTRDAVLDTTAGVGTSGALRKGTTLQVTVAGRSGVPSTGATAVLLEVTVRNPASATRLTVFPTGNTRPATPDVEAAANRVTSALLAVPLGTNGRVAFFNELANANVTAEVVGWFAAGSDYAPLPKANLRTGSLLPAAPVDVTIAGRGGVPASGAGAVLVDLHATAGPAAAVVSAGTPAATAPALTLSAGERRNTLVALPLGDDGLLRFSASGALTELDVSVVGWFRAATAAPDGSTWQFRPASTVILTANGDRVNTHLENIGADGAPTGAYLPAGTTWSTTGDAGSAQLLVTGRGTARVTATTTIGSMLISATPVGASSAAVLTVSNSRLAAGVATLADNRIVYPAPASPAGGSFAPFTQAELNARISVPAADAADPWGTGVRMPVVLSGAMPANGQLLLSTGDGGVAGRIVSTAALPSLRRGGKNLVTIEVLRPQDLFTDVKFDLPDSAPASGLFGGATSTASRAMSIRAAADPVAACEATGGVSVAEVKIVNSEVPVPVIRTGFWFIVSGHQLNFMRLRATAEARGFAELSVAVQGAGEITAKCPLRSYAVDVPVAGPASALSTATYSFDTRVEASIKVTGGPKLELKYRCEVAARTGFEVRWNTNEGVTTRKDPESITGSCRPSVGIGTTDAGLTQAKVDAKFGVYGNLDLGSRLGGVVMSRIAAVTGRTNLGVVKLMSLKIGPQIHLEWENESAVLAAKGAGARIVAELAVNATVGLEGIESAIRRYTGVPTKLSITLFDLAIAGESYFVAPTDGAPQVLVNGQAATADETGKIPVRPGDAVTVTSRMQFPVNGIVAASATVEGGTAWVSSPNGLPPTKTDEFHVDASTPVPALIATATISDTFCNDVLGRDGRTVSFLATTHELPWLPASGWGGEISLHCGGPKLAFDPVSVVFSAAETTGGTSRSATLRSEFAEGRSWLIVPSTVPAWLHLDASSGTFTASPDDAPITMTVDCDAVPNGGIVNAELNAQLQGGTGLPTQATLVVAAECKDDYLRVEPEEVRGSGGAAIDSNGLQPDRWTISGVPAWATATPTARDLAAGHTVTSVSFAVQRREATCQDQPERSATITFASTNRGSDTLRLVDPKVPKISPCPRPGANGDPHMASSDGLFYDAQVLGEYVYLESTPGSGGDFMIQARHERSAPEQLNGPTSITALAIRVDGHLVEVYARPMTVLLDRAPLTLPEGVPYAVSDTLSLTLDGEYLYVSTSLGMIDVRLYDSESLPPWLNLDVHFDGTMDMDGLLGRPDGDQSNDLLPRGATEGFTIEEVRNHTPQLYELTDSWRLTNPNDSLFTQHYDGFDEPNSPMTEAALAPFRQHAYELLGDITKVCGGGAPTISDYAVDALAVELAIGRDPGDLGEYTCRYVVTGTVHTEGEGYGLAGVVVQLDAPGLSPCQVISNPSGGFLCVMSPALDELAALSPSTALTIHADARWPGDPTPRASVDVSTGALAPLTGTPRAVDADIQVDVGLPLVEVTGRLTDRNGHGLAPRYVQLRGFDATGAYTGATFEWVTPNPADGSFRMVKALPFGTTSAEVSTLTNEDETMKVTAGGLAPLTTTPITFDLDDRPATLDIAGTITLDGEPQSGEHFVQIIEYRADGTYVRNSYLPVMVAADGSFHLAAQASLMADHADVRTWVYLDNGQQSQFAVTATGIALGAVVPVTLDAHAAPPRIRVTGTLQKNGAPPPSPLRMVVLAYDAQGTAVLEDYFHWVTVDPGTGGYTLDAVLPQTAVRAVVIAPLGGSYAESPTLELTGLQPGVTTTATLDGSYAPPVVHLAGRASMGGAPLPAGTHLQVRVLPHGADGALIVAGSGSWDTLVDASGGYAADFVLPIGTVDVTFEVLPLVPGGHGLMQSTSTSVGSATTPLVLDLDSTVVHLHGA